jgi:hypothetical protein
MLEEIETDLADGKVCLRSPAPVSNDRGCPGVLFEEVGFAVDSLPEEAGFEFAFPQPVTINLCWRESKSDPVWSPL